MKKIKIEANQSLRDVALQYYGTMEALGEILSLNCTYGTTTMRNDRAALVALGIDYINDTSFYLDVPLEVGSVVVIDDESRAVNRNIIRELQSIPQTKYTL